MPKQLPALRETTDEQIVSHIYMIRGQMVMLDKDLAELYGVEVRALNQAVKRNPNRFPENFMFRLTHGEMQNWKSQIVISNSVKMGLRKLPYAFLNTVYWLYPSYFAPTVLYRSATKSLMFTSKCGKCSWRTKSFSSVWITSNAGWIRKTKKCKLSLPPSKSL